MWVGDLIYNIQEIVPFLELKPSKLPLVYFQADNKLYIWPL